MAKTSQTPQMTYEELHAAYLEQQKALEAANAEIDGRSTKNRMRLGNTFFTKPFGIIVILVIFFSMEACVAQHGESSGITFIPLITIISIIVIYFFFIKPRMKLNQPARKKNNSEGKRSEWKIMKVSTKGEILKSVASIVLIFTLINNIGRVINSISDGDFWESPYSFSLISSILLCLILYALGEIVVQLAKKEEMNSKQTKQMVIKKEDLWAHLD